MGGYLPSKVISGVEIIFLISPRKLFQEWIYLFKTFIIYLYLIGLLLFKGDACTILEGDGLFSQKQISPMLNGQVNFGELS